MEEKLKQLKKEFGNKFYKGLYPYINGACEITEIWEWIVKKFEAEVSQEIAGMIKEYKDMAYKEQNKTALVMEDIDWDTVKFLQAKILALTELKEKLSNFSV